MGERRRGEGREGGSRVGRRGEQEEASRGRWGSEPLTSYKSKDRTCNTIPCQKKQFCYAKTKKFKCASENIGSPGIHHPGPIFQMSFVHIKNFIMLEIFICSFKNSIRRGFV